MLDAKIPDQGVDASGHVKAGVKKNKNYSKIIYIYL